MSRKRKCIVILLFIVIVSILFILYNRSQFFFGTLYHCTYSVYQLHSKSFKNHKNLIAPKCPNRLLTVDPGGRLGNIILEYMSVLAFHHVYRFNGSIFINPMMRAELRILFQKPDFQSNLQLTRSCRRGRLVKGVGLMQTPNSSYLALNHLVVVLDAYSSRYADLIQYGLENLRLKFRFHPRWIARGTNNLKKIKATYGFDEADNVTFIGIHYRGGDYNSELTDIYKEKFVGPPSFRYYRKAMEYFERTTENPIFVFTTIDKDWAAKNVRYLRIFNIFQQSTVGAVEDFVTLSLCNHSIINYGTYGVASAIFAHGTTFVYDLKLPNDGRGFTLASNMAQFAPNWILCDDKNHCNT